MAIQWTDDLAVGIEEIDRQHQELYVMVAALHDAMRMNQLDRVLGVVSFLERYALEHFATEERHMAAQAYPRLPEHRALHESFVSDLQQHKAAIDANGVRPSLVVALSDWVGSWLGHHLRKVDGEMGRFLRSRGASGSAGLRLPSRECAGQSDEE